MKYFEPTELVKGQFEFNETVNGGFATRGDCYYYRIITRWNSKLECIYAETDGDNYTDNLENNKINMMDKVNDFHYNRTQRAITRHLKYLKIYLGLEKQKEIEKKKVLYRIWYPYSKVQMAEVEFSKNGNPKIEGSRSSHSWAFATKENVLLANQYNDLLKNFTKAERELRKKLFPKDQY